VTASPRFGSRRAPFDAPLFLRRLYLQPAALWLALEALTAPVARAVPGALRASCAGPARDGLVAAATVVYIPLVPALIVVAYHLGFARRRLEHAAHRWVADLSFSLLLAVSAANAAILLSQGSAHWPTLGPELSAMRAACWPGR
jgi:hypothetical protein